MKKIASISLVVFLSLAGLALVKDLFLKSAVTGVASKMVGAPVSMRSLSFSLIQSTIHIKGFRIDNPSGFPKGILVSIPTIKVKYDRSALFKKKLHIFKAEIDLKEVGLIRNKEGQLNVDSLDVAKKESKEPKKTKSKPMPLQIDVLDLSIGKIVIKDYTHGAEPTVQVRDMNIHKSYKNITSPEQLVLLILSEPVKEAGIQGAKIYGAALLTGGAILPVAAVFTLAGKDNVEQSVKGSFEHVYAISKKVMERMGTITEQDTANGEIKATINGANVTLHLQKQKDGKIGITISARKFMLPKPDIAGGVLYQIVEKL